ncbi:MAG: hypothetical protein IMY67_13050 [Bacteroidetes bacterium]|nr:hypothetical protein [Bacteroidota bacterium]
MCFTIMPFGGWFDNYYTEIYMPAIKKANVFPARADDLYRPSTIINDIWDYIQNSSIILADLTGRNPNVLYELGLAHAIAKPVIIVTESIDDIPFDLRSLRIIQYDKNVTNWGEKLKDNIISSILEVLDSPITAVLPTFIDVDTKKVNSISEVEKQLIEIHQEIDMLKREREHFNLRNQMYQDLLPVHKIDVERPIRITLTSEVMDNLDSGWSPENILAHYKANGKSEKALKAIINKWKKR